MKRFLLVRVLTITIAIMASSQTAAAHITRYSGTISLDPRTAAISEHLLFDFVTTGNRTSTLVVYLNPDLQIQAVSCSECIRFSEGATDLRTYTRPVKIFFKSPQSSGKKIHIKFMCSGKLSHVSSDTNSLTPDWVELSVDSGWYPFELEDRDFHYDLTLDLDSAYKLVANATITGGSGHWRLVQNDPSNDIDLAAAQDWRKTNISTGTLHLELYSINAPEKDLQRIASLASDATNRFSQWFGNPPRRNLTIVLNPRVGGSSYSRFGYVSLAYSNAPEQQDSLNFTLTHEIAHFWWIGAPSSTWENWLNESFAEYSALMYLRSTKGETAFNNAIQQREARSKALPAIWGVSRKDRHYPAVIYAKGAVRLHDLEGMLGQERFLLLLRNLVSRRVHSTARFLSLLRESSSKEVSRRFEELLKR